MTADNNVQASINHIIIQVIITVMNLKVNTSFIVTQHASLINPFVHSKLAL